MSIMPFLMDFSETYQMDYENEYDDDFGFLVYPHELHRRAHRPPRLQMYSTRRLPYNVGGVKNLPTTTTSKSKIDGEKTVTSSSLYSTIGKNGFQVCMNVQQFKPNELSVKTVDNTVVVEGKHEEREDDNGLISRHFTRKYNLPKGYDPKEVTSTLSSDGILTIKSPLPAKLHDSAERIIQIQHTGPAHLSVKSNDNSKAITTPAANNMMNNVNKNSASNMNSNPILNNNSNSSSTIGTTTQTINNNNNNPVATNNTNQDVPTTIQKEKSDIIIKEKCENGEKSENDKIIEQNNEVVED